MEQGDEDDHDQLQALQEAQLLAAGHSAEEIAEIRQLKRARDECAVCNLLIKSEAWDTDPSVSIAKVYLCFAAALERLNRWPKAIAVLETGCAKYPSVCALPLAKARLCFKAGRKVEALELCLQVCQAYEDRDGQCTPDEAADAFHLAGWVMIHSYDDHTKAYQLWKRGAAAVQACEAASVLKTQEAKRKCWDIADPTDISASRSLVGAAPVNNAVEGFAVVEHLRKKTPALALFDAALQQSKLVFRSQAPVLTSDECARVLKEVEDFHYEHRGGIWGTVRQATVKTTDVAVEDIPTLRPWLRELLRTRLYPMLAQAYPQLADGTTLTDPSTGESRMRVHDAFIVRYDAVRDGSLSLPEHSDTSALSFTVALNSCDGEFDGGGTWFEALGDRGQVIDAELGHAVAFAGPLRHAGFPITRGTRIILVLFLYVDKYPYGELLNTYKIKHDCKSCSKSLTSEKESGTRPSGDDPGGYVVYKQTVELVNMLNREVESVLDA